MTTVSSVVACTGKDPGVSAGSGTDSAGPYMETYGCSQAGTGGELRGALARDTSTDTSTSTTTEGDTTSTTGPTVLTTGTTAPEDYEAMDGCGIAQVCERIRHQTVEPSPDHGSDDYPEEERCFLEGLRDSRPGAYRSVVNPVWANGAITETHILHVGLDRQVTFVRHYRRDVYFGETSELVDEYDPAKTCTLVTPGFFSDCLADYDDSDHFYDCLDPDLWWTQCAESEPWCPCGPD